MWQKYLWQRIWHTTIFIGRFIGRNWMSAKMSVRVLKWLKNVRFSITVPKLPHFFPFLFYYSPKNSTYWVNVPTLWHLFETNVTIWTVYQILRFYKDENFYIFKKLKKLYFLFFNFGIFKLYRKFLSNIKIMIKIILSSFCLTFSKKS